MALLLAAVCCSDSVSIGRFEGPKSLRQHIANKKKKKKKDRGDALGNIPSSCCGLGGIGRRSGCLRFVGGLEGVMNWFAFACECRICGLGCVLGPFSFCMP